MTIILTVQSCGNKKFRLGINSKDSKEIFKNRKVDVVLKLSDIQIIKTQTTCGTLYDQNRKVIKGIKKGYDLYHSDLHKWIKEHHFCRFTPRNPTKLVFLKEKDGLIFKFLHKVE